jgi:predicted dehydrogenase
MLKVAIIGCGALGRVHADRLGAMTGVEVTAIADPNEDNLKAAARQIQNSVKARTDYREILDRGLDAVCIASPDAMHVAQVLDSLAANLHVLCEKPLTADPDELEAVIASRDETGKVVALTYPRRYDAGIRAMEREIKSGKWGRVLQITMYNAEDWITPNRDTWRHDPQICPGGFFYDASGHQIDTVLWVTGLAPVRVFARMSNRGMPSPMAAWGTALLDGGVPVTFAFEGAAHVWREQINIHCEGMDFAILNSKAFWLRAGQIVPMAPGEPDEHADDAFIGLIREGGRNWAPPEDVWPVLRFTRAALDSAAFGREVEVEKE